jgi:hypothetical protein
MPLGSTFESDILNLVLAGKPISSMATSAGSTLNWSALHTADPSSGDQNTSEVALTAYTRVSVNRSTTGWAVAQGTSNATASPVAAITFPMLTSTSTGTATHWSVGFTSAGTGKIIASGAISPTIALGQNVTPQLTTGSSITLS